MQSGFNLAYVLQRSVLGFGVEVWGFRCWGSGVGVQAEGFSRSWDSELMGWNAGLIV